MARLQAVDQVSGGKEYADALHNRRKSGKRNGRAGEKNQREPEKLIDDLRFLHGVGDAGDHQAERGEGNGADSDENKDGQQIAEIVHVEK